MKTSKCKGLNHTNNPHNPNPGRIVVGGGICVECGYLVKDSKKDVTGNKNIHITGKKHK